MGKVKKLFFTIIFICWSLGIIFSCSKENEIIIISKQTLLLKKPMGENAIGNDVISVLDKGERGIIIGITYSKEFMFYKMRTYDGREGFVIYNGSNEIKKDTLKQR